MTFVFSSTTKPPSLLFAFISIFALLNSFTLIWSHWKNTAITVRIFFGQLFTFFFRPAWPKWIAFIELSSICFIFFAFYLRSIVFVLPSSWNAYLSSSYLTKRHQNLSVCHHFPSFRFSHVQIQNFRSNVFTFGLLAFPAFCLHFGFALGRHLHCPSPRSHFIKLCHWSP